MLHPVSAYVCAVIAVFLCVTSAHEHHKQHSHLCKGGGYNLFCNDGYKFRIDKAWYGRIANDNDSCSPKPNVTQPPLKEDCGSSIMDSRATWCHNANLGGCTIYVENLEPKTETVACPAGVTDKYLYLEYECEEHSSGAKMMVDMTVLWFAVFSFLTVRSSR